MSVVVEHAIKREILKVLQLLCDTSFKTVWSRTVRLGVPFHAPKTNVKRFRRFLTNKCVSLEGGWERKRGGFVQWVVRPVDHTYLFDYLVRHWIGTLVIRPNRFIIRTTFNPKRPKGNVPLTSQYRLTGPSRTRSHRRFFPVLSPLHTSSWVKVVS